MEDMTEPVDATLRSQAGWSGLVLLLNPLRPPDVFDDSEIPAIKAISYCGLSLVWLFKAVKALLRKISGCWSLLSVIVDPRYTQLLTSSTMSLPSWRGGETGPSPTSKNMFFVQLT